MCVFVTVNEDQSYFASTVYTVTLVGDTSKEFITEYDVKEQTEIFTCNLLQCQLMSNISMLQASQSRCPFHLPKDGDMPVYMCGYGNNCPKKQITPTNLWN
jgi:hypothetical protein